MRSYPFSVKDKEYWLKYDFNNICDMEDLSGKPIQTIFDEHHMGLTTIRLLIWGGLKHSDRGITLQRAGMIVRDYMEEGGTLNELSENATKCLMYALKIEVDEENEGGEETEGE